MLLTNQKTINYEIYINTETLPFCECKGKLTNYIFKKKIKFNTSLIK
jgi:hypothetical protein